MNNRKTAGEIMILSDFHMPAIKMSIKKLKKIIDAGNHQAFMCGDFMEFDSAANEDLFVLRQEVKNAITKAGAIC